MSGGNVMRTPFAFRLVCLAICGVVVFSRGVRCEPSRDNRKSLDRNGQAVLNDSEAAELAAKAWDDLYLSDVTTISDTALIALAKHKGGLMLHRLPTLSLVAAEALSTHEGNLFIGVEDVDDDVIALLSRNKGTLGLNNLKSLSLLSAKHLAEYHNGVLGLNSVTTLSPEVARVLASHNGALGLTGVEELSPEAAAGLAKCKHALFLSDRAAFSEATRRELSGRIGLITLGDGFELPQVFPCHSGWQAESDSKVSSQHNKLIDAAIAQGLGLVSKERDASAIGGVRLGVAFRDLNGIGLHSAASPIRWIVPAPGEKKNPYAENPVFVLVDALSGNTVGIEKMFQGTTLAESVDVLVERFGKTPQEIVEQTVTLQSRGMKRTVIRYTFPNELVRVVGVNEGSARGVNHNTVVISVSSREWVENNLRALGNALLSACRWASTAMDAFTGESFDVEQIPVLPGTERELSAATTCCRFEDIKRVQLLGNEAFTKGRDRGEFPTGMNPIVAAVGQVNGMPFVIIDPLNSTVAGIRPLVTSNQLIGDSDIRCANLGDLVLSVASHLVQHEFQPTTDKISVFNNVAMRMRLPESITDQAIEMFLGSEGVRHEWLCANGWTARVTEGGMLCFFLDPRRSRNKIELE